MAGSQEGAYHWGTMEYLLTAAVLGALALGYLLLKRVRGREQDESQWILLLVPGEADDRLGRDVRKILARLGFQARHLSETGMSLGRALGQLRPVLIVAHQPSYGGEIEQRSQDDSALASTPVLYLDTGIQRNRSPLRAHLPPGARPAQVAARVIDLLNTRPGPEELSRLREVRLGIQAGRVLEFLHFLHSMGRSGRIEVRTRQVSGSAWMEKGRIVHATVGGLEGIEALHSMLDFVQGSITFSPGMAPTRRSILDGAMAVLAEYARRRDELAKASGN